MEASAAAAPRSEDGVAEPLRIEEAAGWRFRVLSRATLRDGCEKRPPPPSREQPLHLAVAALRTMSWYAICKDFGGGSGALGIAIRNYIIDHFELAPKIGSRPHHVTSLQILSRK